MVKRKGKKVYFAIYTKRGKNHIVHLGYNPKEAKQKAINVSENCNCDVSLVKTEGYIHHIPKKKYK